MSIWSRVSDFLTSLSRSGRSLLETPDWLRRDADRQVRFTIAVIALGAKMAKADGTVSVNEVRVFREIFRIEKRDEKHAARVYNLARRSTAGFESYGRILAGLFPGNSRILGGVLEGLFQIAVADGELEDSEIEFLYSLNGLFGFSDDHFDGLHGRFSGELAADPYRILGVAPDAPLEEIRRRWRMLVKQVHPDILVAEGMPHEAIRLAENRLAAYNGAWALIRSMHEDRLPDKAKEPRQAGVDHAATN